MDKSSISSLGYVLNSATRKGPTCSTERNTLATYSPQVLSHRQKSTINEKLQVTEDGNQNPKFQLQYA